MCYAYSESIAGRRGAAVDIIRGVVSCRKHVVVIVVGCFCFFRAHMRLATPIVLFTRPFIQLFPHLHSLAGRTTAKPPNT